MGGGEDVTYYNPGTIDLKQTNPEAFKEVDFLRNLRDQYRGNTMDAFNPGNYAARAGESMTRADTAIQNRYAQAGLANSSASFGAQNESDRQIMNSYDQQRLSDMLKSMQVQAALSGQITGNISGIQNQFANTQNQFNNAILNSNAQQSQLYGSLIGAAGTIGGVLAAPATGGLSLLGPMAMGGMGGSGGYSAPTSPSPSYAPSGYSVGNAYGMYGGY